MINNERYIPLNFTRFALAFLYRALCSFGQLVYDLLWITDYNVFGLLVMVTLCSMVDMLLLMMALALAIP